MTEHVVGGQNLSSRCRAVGMMRRAILFLSLISALSAPASADVYTQMKLTGAGLVSWGGVYVSPYEATTDGANRFMVACLDLALRTNVNQWYWYNISTPATGDSTPFVNYQAAAILMEDLIGATGDTRGELSWAIWYIFNPTAVNSWNHSQVQNNLTDIHNRANAALTDATNGVGIPNFRVYYPDPDHTPPVGTAASQRFIEVLPPSDHVPDGGMTLVLLGGVLIGLERLRRRLT